MMPKKKESYVGIEAYKGLKRYDIIDLTESQLRAYLRTGAHILASNLKGREKAGLPAFEIPKTVKGRTYTAKELRNLLLKQREIMSDPKRTAEGFRQVSEKTLSKMYERATGSVPKITLLKEGLWLNVTYMSYEELNRFFEEFHKARETAGWNRGSIGSADLLKEYIDMYESASFEDFLKKSKERIKQIEEDEKRRIIEDAETIEDDDYLPW